jgi:protein-disulfide isomerase
MSKQFLGVIVAIILVFVGVFALTNHKTTSTTASGKKSSSSTLTQHVEGKGTTGVSLVEYGDYECPYCEQYSSTVRLVQAEFNDQIKFQFRNFPLTSLHRNAFAAARAAEAAGLQNKFWEMHDALYDPSAWQSWTTATDPTTFFNQYAQILGLNVTQFKKDFASDTVNSLVNADMGEGNKLGVSGTPSFFLDGKQIQVANTQAAFEKVIKDAIAKKAKAS